MSSFMDFYQDFLQKKDSSECRRASAVSLPEEEQNDVSQTESSADNVKKMEHSYNRDVIIKPVNDVSNGLPPARTILVRKTPQCSSCHPQPIEDHDMHDGNQAIVPSFNEITAKEAMNECARIAKYVKNVNPDDEDWESRINQSGWTTAQKSFYDKVVKILDSDQLGRLANVGRQAEVVQRRILIDKSAFRMRKALSNVNWDHRLTQWLHCLLMDYLPPSYMASYLDILQTLKSKVPTLIDKMLFMRPLNISQELLAPVMKKQWEPVINTKPRALTQSAIFVAIPSLPFGSVPKRLQKLYQSLASIAPIIQVTLPSANDHMINQPLEQVAEQIVSLARVKIQELRHEDAARNIILIGFGAGSAFALQVAMSECVASVVCLGFSVNTLHGPRGAPDDRLLDLKIPILFVIGQNSQRTSFEEMEQLRERLQSESSLVIVGCGDDFLRLPKSRKKIENVTQAMVDSMIIDEVFEFVKKILTNPPGPRTPNAYMSLAFKQQNKTVLGPDSKIPNQRKRKSDGTVESEVPTVKTKFTPHIGRPRTRPLITTPTLASKTKIPGASGTSPQQISKADNDEINSALQSILQDGSEDMDASSGSLTESPEKNPKKTITSFELVAQSKSNPITTTILNANNAAGTKIRMIPSNQFVQLKPTVQNPSKFITIKQNTIGSTQQSGGGVASIGSIVKTSAISGQQQIFTLKSPNGQTTQFVTAASTATPQKYTVVKNSSGGTTLQLAKTTNESSISNSTPNLDLSNIIDMPIVFADNDGNIADSVPQSSSSLNQTASDSSKSSGVGQLIINQKIIRDVPITTAASDIARPSGSTIVLSKSGLTSANSPILGSSFSNKGNKVLYINRNTMKPCSNIITRPNINQKFANVVVTNPKISGGTTIIQRPSMIISTSANQNSLSSAGNTVKPATIQTIKTTGLPTVARPTSGILNVSTKTLPQLQIINSPSNVTATSTPTTLGDKPQIRNIVLKTGGSIKQLPQQIGSQLLNRNVTVRKLVNIVPINRPVVTTNSGGLSISQVTVPSQIIADGSSNDTTITSSPTAVIQTSPKILTLTPASSNSSPSTASNTNPSIDSE